MNVAGHRRLVRKKAHFHGRCATTFANTGGKPENADNCGTEAPHKGAIIWKYY